MSKVKDTFRLGLIALSVCVMGIEPASNGQQGLQSAKSKETSLPHALRTLLSSSDNGGLSLFLDASFTAQRAIFRPAALL